jgi:hypothetical protein
MFISDFKQLQQLEEAKAQDKLVSVMEHRRNTTHLGTPRDFTTSGMNITGYHVTTVRGHELLLSLDDGFYVVETFGREYAREAEELVYG